ncbi:MAG TPA: hypothetical protein VMV89_00530 [Candidatus Paceibacterota bacterium]|nr:hypothetical protein [Candidatus Paceibacterota bacterium]
MLKIWNYAHGWFWAQITRRHIVGSGAGNLCNFSGIVAFEKTQRFGPLLHGIIPLAVMPDFWISPPVTMNIIPAKFFVVKQQSQKRQ